MPRHRRSAADEVAELSDHLIDRMWAIGIQIHNELVRSGRQVVAERGPAAAVALRSAVDELDALVRTTRASLDDAISHSDNHLSI
ncbi:hypothetical protein BJY24_007148 [Nocardia transvalensis]|uniref:Uncharacterized protein n=1 Tax=Nocardia transvalensis TaxID=37333 RepID=A0A7W9PL75_9NOCA|nr:hypothetical protein [Nocardia transvalensis]MBB5918236.1 hypothetical protein [Nocardia transvalensis]